MPRTIFVVDDVSTNLYMAEKSLKKQFNVTTLGSAEAMFKALDKSMPDLILLDIEMPVMDGFEAIKLLKANDTYAKIPVIFYTSKTDNDTQIKCLELGAVDIIEKPCPEPLLNKRIKNYLICIEQIPEKTAQSPFNTKYNKSFVRAMNKHISRLEEILDKNGNFDKSDLLIYSVNSQAIKDALAGIEEWELSRVAEKLAQAGFDKNINEILTQTPGFIDALRAIVNKHVLEL